MSMVDLSHRHNVCTQGLTGGGCSMEVSAARRLRALEAENTELKRLLADAMLDIAALKEVVSPR